MLTCNINAIIIYIATSYVLDFVHEVSYLVFYYHKKTKAVIPAISVFNVQTNKQIKLLKLS